MASSEPDYPAFHTAIPAGRVIPDGGVNHSAEVAAGIILDYGVDKEIIGVEILGCPDTNSISSILAEHGLANGDIENIMQAMGKDLNVE